VVSVRTLYRGFLIHLDRTAIPNLPFSSFPPDGGRLDGFGSLRFKIDTTVP